PHVGITRPRDDGSARFAASAPTLEAYAADRDGLVERVEFYAGAKRIGMDAKPPYQCVWEDAKAGCYDLTAVAYDNSGRKSTSNTVRAIVGLVDIAKGKPVVASSGASPQKAVDGDYFTSWASAKSGDEWIYVDLGQPYEIQRVNLLWGWKIHAADFTLDVATSQPGQEGSWSTVYKKTDRPYVSWEATDRVTFAKTTARYVRLHATKRASNQTWAGYKLAAFEVLVKAE
ncbi:hypothetical protein GF373_05630, partial [bacterium]|nr:hypothetical protein [bacterium]